MKNIVIVTLFCFLSMPAMAWDKVVTGKIQTLEFHSGWSSGRDVTVRIDGESVLCTRLSGNDVGYVMRAELGERYEPMLSALLAARMAGTEVTLYLDPSDEGCKVGRVDI
mgnify:CR=1 FL=1